MIDSPPKHVFFFPGQTAPKSRKTWPELGDGESEVGVQVPYTSS